MTDKKALKPAVLTAVVALVVFEALCILVQLIDPEGGLLRVNFSSPLQHVIIVLASLGFGIYAYIRERKKDR